jgi:hypothetical protein
MCDTSHLIENNRVSPAGLPVDGRLEEDGANYVDTWKSTLFVDGGTPLSGTG